MLRFKVEQPSQKDVALEVNKMYDSFRFYYCRKPENILSRITIANNSYIVQDGFFTRCVDSFHYPLHHKVVQERNIREFFHHHFKQHMTVTTNALREVTQAYKQLQQCYYKGYEKDTRLNALQKTKIGLVKKHYDAEVRVWKEFSTTHISLCSMLPSFEEHIKHEFAYFKKYMVKLKKKYKADMRQHKKLMVCVQEELTLAFDAIKKHFRRQ